MRRWGSDASVAGAAQACRRSAAAQSSSYRRGRARIGRKGRTRPPRPGPCAAGRPSRSHAQQAHRPLLWSTQEISRLSVEGQAHAGAPQVVDGWSASERAAPVQVAGGADSRCRPAGARPRAWPARGAPQQVGGQAARRGRPGGTQLRCFQHALAASASPAWEREAQPGLRIAASSAAWRLVGQPAFGSGQVEADHTRANGRTRRVGRVDGQGRGLPDVRCRPCRSAQTIRPLGNGLRDSPSSSASTAASPGDAEGLEQQRRDAELGQHRSPAAHPRRFRRPPAPAPGEAMVATVSAKPRRY